MNPAPEPDPARPHPGGGGEPSFAAELKAASPPVPARIGRYAISGVLGEGGMGIVYRAVQENPQRVVALKIIRSGFFSLEVLRRFHRESQVLARLQHPGIAAIYEAGMSEDELGQPMPFFAMELVHGVPLTEHASRKNLGVRERLELMARVSDAVEHAHQKGVIHRDLKPGNILVDDAGQPKILDFGIARATDSDVQQTTLQTDVGQLVGTIPYMSPEQVGGDPDELDTRSDVYALGVITYELLSGRLPYDVHRKMIPEVARIIREEEPSRLSSTDRTLRGDVETIVSKALEKDKVRRYQSAESFGSDIRRYLKDEPITARPPSTWYQVQKFSRRHTGLVAGIGVAFVLLIAGVVGTSLALRRALGAEGRLTAQLAQTEEARAESERQKTLAESNAAAEMKARKRAEAINAFVTKALQSSDPMLRGHRDTTIVEAMGNVVREIDAGTLKDDPETEAGLLGTIGIVLKNEGKYSQSESLLERSLEESERVFGKDTTPVATCLHSLGQLHAAKGESALAEPLFQRALAIWEKNLGPDHQQVASALGSLAQLYYNEGQYDRAQPLFERSLAISEKADGPSSREVAMTLNDLALLHSALEQYPKAEELMRRALAIYEAKLGPDHPDVAACLNTIALMKDRQGQYTEAEPLFVRALAICEKALGPEHALVATGLHNLAELYREERRFAEAQPLYERAIAIYEKLLGPDHPQVAIILFNLAHVHADQKQFDLAEALYARVLGIDEKSRGPESIDVADDLLKLAGVYEEEGRYDAAEPLYERSVAIREKQTAPDRKDLGISLNNLARTRQKLGKPALARETFDRAIAVLREQDPGGSATLARVLSYSARARMDEKGAAEALPEIEEAMAMGEKFLPPGDERLETIRRTLSDCRSALGR